MAKIKKIVNDLVVLDTSVILYDADCIYKFGNYDVVIPLVVLDEIDKFKSLENEAGRNARKFIRSVNDLRTKGNLNKGVVISDIYQSTLSVRFLTDYSGLSTYSLDMGKNDDKILAVCLERQRDFSTFTTNRPTVSLVTKDISMTVKAHVLGIGLLDYSEDRPIQDSSELYSGILDLYVDPTIIDVLHSEGMVSVEDCSRIMEDFPLHIYDNTGITLISNTNPNHTALCLYRGGFFRKLKYDSRTVNNVSAKNREQAFAMEFLLDPDIKLVTLTGAAGTGKTVLSIACSLYMAFDAKKYDRLVVSRPIQPLGKDIGYLPGDALEKMDPWMGPIRDAIEFVFNGDRTKYDELINFGALDIEPLTYIRGRSLPKTLFILDEAQNLTRHEMKTIISRIGKGSKIILTGDVLQIDNHYLDATNNGLTIVLEKFKDIDIAAHISLVKGQRSRLASLAADIL